MAETINLPCLRRRIDNQEDICPYCGSDEISGGPVETGAGEATQPMDCFVCEMSWIDGYRLTSCLVTVKPREKEDGQENTGPC